MHTMLLSFAIAGFFILLTAASGPTKLYIDSVPEYDLLPSCAEQQVSLVVRSMAYGCGDGSQTTSYACFCYRSSAYYSRMISTRVTSACSKTHGPESSAIEVFSKYCKLGDIEKATTTADLEFPEPTISTTLTQSTIAFPASTPAATTASPTGTPAPQTETPPPQSTPPTKKKSIATIAAGVTVPVAVIALGLVGLFIYLRRRKAPPPSELAAGHQTNEVSEAQMAHEKYSTTYAYEKDTDRLHEIYTNEQPRELAGSSSEQDRDIKIGRLVGNSGRV